MSKVLVETIKELSTRGGEEAISWNDLLPAPVREEFAFTSRDGGPTSFSRAQSAVTFTAGGALVDETISRVVDLLRPRNILARLGAQFIQVRGNARVPKITSGATASWLSETGELSDSSIVFGDLNLSPRRCSAVCAVSTQLLAQSPELAQAAIQRDLFGAIGEAIDIGAFSGLGNAEPVGLSFLASVPEPVSFGGAATLADAIEFEQTLGDANGEGVSPTFVSSPSTRAKWRAIEAFSGGGRPLWDIDGILGHRAVATSSIADDRMFYANFDDYLVCFFGGGISILVDPYALKKSGQVEIQITLLADMGPTRLDSFARSTDSANQ